ncbi:hypothetical protein LSCM1_06647 [Leishmania martiniquensis]|uniref:RRM domain-containing protein n=1 Tax=Leishmania martiniquensis TaxID=1580590 RepID=A0A836HQV1_9TRYP|nr:hypothetical protein LSCM1_06647 [Leishmania martiniquensis]
MVNPAAVVHVFLDDASKAVSMEDMKEWLEIMNEVVEIKLQFDAATGRTCYYVEFRSPVAAQQAVHYLSGARLKNCLVTIESRVYSPLPGAQGHPSTAGEALETASAAPTQSRKRCRETSELPSNHLLPSDLQMDAPLAECLPHLEKVEPFSADGFAMWQQLREAQKELVGIYSELEAIKTEVESTDAQLARLLHAHRSESAHGGALLAHPPSLLRARKSTLQAHHCLCHQRAIPFNAHTPTRVVALLTDSFGPLSLCSEVLTQDGFFLAVRFLFAADEEAFMSAASASGLSKESKERAQYRGAEWKNIVQGLGWRPADNLVSVHHLFPRTVDAHLERALRELLA